MKFTKFLNESEKFVSAKFHADKNDPTESLFKRTIEEFLAAAQKLDHMKKNKFYGKKLPAGFQTTIPYGDNFDYEPTNAEKTLHGAIGLATESAELLEAVYKEKWHGKKLDMVNLVEETGDIFWYLAILFRQFSWGLDRILKINIDKLTKRYGKAFSAKKAIERNLETERNVLEGNITQK